MNWEDFDLALGKTSSGLVVNAESDASDVEMTPGDEEPASDDPSDEESVPDQYSDSSDEEYVEDAETKPRPGQRVSRFSTLASWSKWLTLGVHLETTSRS